METNDTKSPHSAPPDDSEPDGVDAANAIGKLRVSYAVVREVLATVREVLASPSVGPYLKYPILAIAIGIIILASCFGYQWVTR